MEYKDCCADYMLECPVEYAVGLAAGWGDFQGDDGSADGGDGTGRYSDRIQEVGSSGDVPLPRR